MAQPGELIARLRCSALVKTSGSKLGPAFKSRAVAMLVESSLLYEAQSNSRKQFLGPAEFAGLAYAVVIDVAPEKYLLKKLVPALNGPADRRAARLEQMQESVRAVTCFRNHVAAEQLLA